MPRMALLAGTCWLLLVLAFERVGSFILRRPIKEILMGQLIEKGWTWPFVLSRGRAPDHVPADPNVTGSSFPIGPIDGCPADPGASPWPPCSNAVQP